MKTENHTFIVTGGASGLGAATIHALHETGAKVVIADVGEDKGRALEAQLGERALFCKTDVTSPADAEATVKSAVARFGALHGLISCAGIGNAGRVLSRNGPMPLDDYSRVINVNLIGTFNMIRIAAAAMAENTPETDGERGVIVNTASVAAFDGQIGQAAYAASKGGIVSMTLPIAREFARIGVRVMTIAPGLFMTPMMETLPQEVQDSLGASIPFPSRLGQPQEYAALVLSIVGNTMLNGETIRLDGAIRLAPK
ncbi:MAG: 3-hydroxyacyl-CoA dehydrogenase [Gammaproteobacteria bacterium]|nr:3-hydroxyacyl-CoA dehydrogenase [Gammaproteobacteria bacterium]